MVFQDQSIRRKATAVIMLTSVAVLLLTAKVQSSDQRRFADLGVESVLFKPFDPLTLADQISAVLGWN